MCKCWTTWREFPGLILTPQIAFRISRFIFYICQTWASKYLRPMWFSLPIKMFKLKAIIIINKIFLFVFYFFLFCCSDTQLSIGCDWFHTQTYGYVPLFLMSMLCKMIIAVVINNHNAVWAFTLDANYQTA